jgi:hypothetical protein
MYRNVGNHLFFFGSPPWGECWYVTILIPLLFRLALYIESQNWTLSLPFMTK